MTIKPFKLLSWTAAAILFVAIAAMPFNLSLSTARAQDGPGDEQDDRPPPPPQDGPRFGSEHGGRQQNGERSRKWNHDGRDNGSPGQEQGRMGRAGRFLGFVSEFNKQVQDPVQAVGLAAVGVKEFYRRQDKPQDAVPVLDEMLKTAKDQRVRNVLLFTIRQIYDEAKDGAKMLELSRQIMQENIAAAEKK